MDRTMRILPWVLFAVAIMRIASVVVPTPLIAYANNWDFAREASCYGVWDAYPAGRDKTTSNFNGPVNPLIYDGDKRPKWCAHVVDNIFIKSVLATHRIGDHVKLQKVGRLRAIFLLLMTAWLLILLKRHRLLAAAVFLIAFGDIAYLSFFNTLYAEFSMLAGAYLTIFAFVLLLHEDKPRFSTALYCIVSILFFAGAKEQYMPLALLAALGLAVIALAKWRSYALAGCILATTALLPTTYFMINSHDNGNVMGTIEVANIMDTVMVGVLPNTNDPIAAMRKLKLPEHCAKAIGVSWYQPGVANNLPCPEVANVSRTQIFKLFFSTPEALYRPLYQAVLRVRPLQLDYLRNAENDAVRGSRRYGVLKSTSLTTYLDMLSPRAFSLFLASLAVLSVAALSRMRRSGTALVATAGLLAAFYALASSVFGDGYMELSKHASLIVMGITASICGGIGMCLEMMTGKNSSDGRSSS